MKPEQERAVLEIADKLGSLGTGTEFKLAFAAALCEVCGVVTKAPSSLRHHRAHEEE